MKIVFQINMDYLRVGIERVKSLLLAYKKSKVNVFVFEDRLRKYIFGEMVPNWFKSAINIKEMTLNE